MEYPESGSGAAHGPPIIISIDFAAPLIFTQPIKLPDWVITTQPTKLPDREIFTQPGGDPGILITTPSDPFPTCSIFERQPDLFPGYLTNDSPRWPHPPRRPDGGWQKGQLTDAEYEFLRSRAIKWGKTIVLTGSLSETDLGLERRYNPELRQYLPDFRQDKPKSDLVETGAGDVDIWQGSDLNDYQLRVIREYFYSIDRRFKVGHPRLGYNRDRYPELETFTKKAGAIVFEPDGTTQRIPAPWQRETWPSERNTRDDIA